MVNVQDLCLMTHKFSMLLCSFMMHKFHHVFASVMITFDKKICVPCEKEIKLSSQFEKAQGLYRCKSPL